MAFIELTMRSDNSKTLVNIDHILRIGSLSGNGDEIGSYVITTSDAGEPGSRNWFHVLEKPSYIEGRMTVVGIPTTR